MKQRIIGYIIRGAVSLLFISILLYIMRDKYGQILAVLKSTSMLFFSAAVIVFAIAIAIASVRFKLIVDAQGDVSITFLEAFSLTFIGYFFNNFLPTSIGGDVVKAYYLSKKSSDKLKSYTSVFVDRAIGLVTMIFMAMVALVFAESHVVDARIKMVIYAITAATLVGILFMLNKDIAKKFSILLKAIKPLENRVRDLYNSIHMYKHEKALVAKALGISVLSQLCFFATIGLLALAIGSAIPPIEILLRVPIISTLSLLPSINGLGLREGATVLMFKPLIGQANAFAVSILWLFVLFIISVAGGFVYGLSPQFKMKLREIEEET